MKEKKNFTAIRHGKQKRALFMIYEQRLNFTTEILYSYYFALRNQFQF